MGIHIDRIYAIYFVLILIIGKDFTCADCKYENVCYLYILCQINIKSYFTFSLFVCSSLIKISVNNNLLNSAIDLNR